MLFSSTLPGASLTKTMVPRSGMGIALKVLGRIGAGAGGQLGGRGEAAHLPNRGAEVPQRTRG